MFVFFINLFSINLENFIVSIKRTKAIAMITIIWTERRHPDMELPLMSLEKLRI